MNCNFMLQMEFTYFCKTPRSAKFKYALWVQRPSGIAAVSKLFCKFSLKCLKSIPTCVMVCGGIFGA